MEVPLGPPDPEWPIRKTRCIPKPPENTGLCTVPETLEVSGQKRLEARGLKTSELHLFIRTCSLDQLNFQPITTRLHSRLRFCV